MSLEIKINGTRVNIRDKQTIAYNLANFDITDIGVRKLNYTNNFQIPVEGNELVFNFASNIGTSSTVPYSALSIDVIADGVAVVTDGSAFIQSFENGFYSIRITDNKDVIADMKAYNLKDLYSGDTITITDMTDLLTNTSGFKMDIIMSEYQVATYAPTDKYEWKNYYDTLSAYIKTIFQKYETENSVTFAGDLWTDTYFEGLRMNVFYCYMSINPISPHAITVQDIILNQTKTFYDLFMLILQVFGATYKITGTTITFKKLDNISMTTYVDWSGKVKNINSKRFNIDGTGQKNHMIYSIQEDAANNLNESIIPCNNLNLPYDVDLFQFGASVYPIVKLSMYTGYTDESTIYFKDNKVKIDASANPILNSSGEIDRPVKDIVLITDGVALFNGITISLYPGLELWEVVGSSSSIKTATYFNSQNEYNLLFDMLYNPVFYEVEMLFNLIDIVFFDPMKLVYIKELGGLYYVNAIKDYLLNSDNKTATVELIKINTYVP